MSTVSSHPRKKYQLRARAERQRQTRERIVAATEQLHREVGPARTSIADIARRAGVQRLTVYNTFPRSSDLFAACQHLFLSQNPPPSLRLPGAGEDAIDCLQRAVRQLYRWYRANEAMERHVYRDRRLLPDLDALMRSTADARLDAVADAIAQSLTSGKPGRALIRMALDFRTWEMLADNGLRDAEMARLLIGAVNAVAGTSSGQSGQVTPRSTRTVGATASAGQPS